MKRLLSENMLLELQLALSFISADDRDDWICIGMAVNDAFGDAGFHYWNEWSKTSDKYDHTSAVASWRSFKSGDGITIGTLIKLAVENGYENNLSKLLK